MFDLNDFYRPPGNRTAGSSRLSGPGMKVDINNEEASPTLAKAVVIVKEEKDKTEEMKTAKAEGWQHLQVGAKPVSNSGPAPLSQSNACPLRMSANPTPHIANSIFSKTTSTNAYRPPATRGESHIVASNPRPTQVVEHLSHDSQTSGYAEIRPMNPSHYYSGPYPYQFAQTGYPSFPPQMVHSNSTSLPSAEHLSHDSQTSGYAENRSMNPSHYYSGPYPYQFAQTGYPSFPPQMVHSNSTSLPSAEHLSHDSQTSGYAENRSMNPSHYYSGPYPYQFAQTGYPSFPPQMVHSNSTSLPSAEHLSHDSQTREDENPAFSIRDQRGNMLLRKIDADLLIKETASTLKAEAAAKKLLKKVQKY